jgi:hypothetical protein
MGFGGPMSHGKPAHAKRVSGSVIDATDMGRMAMVIGFRVPPGVLQGQILFPVIWLRASGEYFHYNPEFRRVTSGRE